MRLAAASAPSKRNIRKEPLLRDKHHYEDYQGHDVVVTTVNNDSLSGRVAWVSKHEVTLHDVELLTDDTPVPLAGVINIRINAIAWVQVHHRKG